MDFNIQISETDKKNIETSINTIKSFILEINDNLNRIKELKEEIKNEKTAVLDNILGRDYAKILVKMLQDADLKNKLETEIDAINYLESVTHVK